MDETNTDNTIITIELTVIELKVLVNALGQSSPVNKELEVVQFKLYHKLLFKLNGLK